MKVWGMTENRQLQLRKPAPILSPCLPLNPTTSDLPMRATELYKSFDMVCLREKVEHLNGSHNITLLKEKSEIASQCWRMATDVKNPPWLKPDQCFQRGVADTRARWVQYNEVRGGTGKTP